MKAPDRYSDPTWWPYPRLPTPQAVTPTVYPIDDEVREGLLGSDGKPLSEGTKRKNPIGFHKQARS